MPQNRISKGAAFLLCVTNTYNDANMVTAMGTEVDGTAVTGFEYTYRTDGNQTQKLDTLLGKTATYTYDGIGQLIHEGYTDADGEIYYSRNYFYDLNGNAILKLT